jgi:hypothetical protein
MKWSNDHDLRHAGVGSARVGRRAAPLPRPALGLDQADAIALLRESGIAATGDEALAMIARRTGRDVLDLAGLIASGVQH